MEAKITIKTIDVNAKEWFDKINGNSYFSAVITLNFGMPDEKHIGVPFQYGYGDQYRYQAFHQLLTDGYIQPTDKEHTLWQYCENNNIVLRHSKKEKCLKREVTAHTQYI